MANDTSQPAPNHVSPDNPASDERPQDAQTPPATRKPTRGGIFGLIQQLREAGREVIAVARGKPTEPPATLDPTLNPPSDTSDDPTLEMSQAPLATETKRHWKVKMLHAATERLRGAADSYIAAKLDEIEVRVDAKLDHVEKRIDAKIIELHRQLRVMRDRELRHRLRILKITLIFTVLVACLSLLYKWIGKIWFS